MGGWLARMRWRRRGAWLWPTFVVATVADGVLVNALPMAGRAESVFGGVALAMVANVIAVVLISRPLGALLRRRRRDLPVGVARNYAGTVAVLLVSAVMVAIGLAHRHELQRQQVALDDAIMRAEAFIGDHAPATFRRNVRHTETYAIQPGSIYRTCVPSLDHARTYCVVVKTALPLAQSVTFAGYESNAFMFQGAG